MGRGGGRRGADLERLRDGVAAVGLLWEEVGGAAGKLEAPTHRRLHQTAAQFEGAVEQPYPAAQFQSSRALLPQEKKCTV
jgi:hypothetical protein